MKINQIQSLSFKQNFNDDIPGILSRCTPANKLGNGLTADVYNIGGGKVAKVYRSKSRSDNILHELREEQTQLEHLHSSNALERTNLCFPKLTDIFKSPDGHAVGIYEKVKGRALSSQDLTNPEVAKEYRRAIHDMRRVGLYSVDVKPDNFMISEE